MGTRSGAQIHPVTGYCCAMRRPSARPALVTTERSGVVTRAPNPETTPPPGRFSGGHARDGFVDYPDIDRITRGHCGSVAQRGPALDHPVTTGRASRTAPGAPTSRSTVHAPSHRLRSVLSTKPPRCLRHSPGLPAESPGNVFIHIATPVAQLKGGVYVTPIVSRPLGATCVYTTAISTRRSVV